MDETAVAEPRGPLAGVSSKLKKKASAAKAHPMEGQKISDFGVTPELEAGDPRVMHPYDEVHSKLRVPTHKRRRSSTASSRRSSASLPPDDRQRSHLCAARAESRADSLCSTQQPATPTGQAGTPDPTCASPSNYSEAAATVVAATVAAAAATVAAAAQDGGRGPSPYPLASPAPSIPSDAESCCLPPLLPPEAPRSPLSVAKPACQHEALSYCDVEGFLPGQGGAPVGPRYTDVHTEKEYLWLPRRPLKIMTYSSNGSYTETVCIGEEEEAAAAAEDTTAAGGSPPPSPAPSAAEAQAPSTAAAAAPHQGNNEENAVSGGGGYQRILWADEVIDASYRRKVWYRTDLHTFFSWLRSPSRHRPVKQRTYNARSLGYSEAKRLAFQFHPEECGDADFKKVYYLWKLKMKGKKKEEEAAAAAAASKEEIPGAPGSAGEGGDAVDGGAGGGDAGAVGSALQPAPNARRGWGPKRRSTRQRIGLEAAAADSHHQQQQHPAPPVSAVARDVLCGNGGFCFSVSTPTQLRYLRDFGTIACAGLEEALFKENPENPSSDTQQASGGEKDEENWRVLAATSWDFGSAGCITFGNAQTDDEGPEQHQQQEHSLHQPEASAFKTLPSGDMDQLQEQHQVPWTPQQKYGQSQQIEAVSFHPQQMETSCEASPNPQPQRKPHQRQSLAAQRRRLAEEQQQTRILWQQQEQQEQQQQQQQQEMALIQQQMQQQMQHQMEELDRQLRHQQQHEFHQPRPQIPEFNLQQQQRQLKYQQRQKLQQQRAELEKQILQKQQQELEQQLVQPHRQGLQQLQYERQQQQKQHRNPLAGRAQRRDAEPQNGKESDRRWAAKVTPHRQRLHQECEPHVQQQDCETGQGRYNQLKQQRQQQEQQLLDDKWKTQQEDFALRQRQQEILALLQHLNPQARQRLQKLLRDGGILGKLGQQQPSVA